MVKVECGVIVKAVAPEHATVEREPWPNSIRAPELIEILEARVVWMKYVAATARSRRAKNAEGAFLP